MINQEPAPDEIERPTPEGEHAGVKAHTRAAPTRFDVYEHVENEIRGNHQRRGSHPHHGNRPAAQIEHPAGPGRPDPAVHGAFLRRQGPGRDRMMDGIRVFAPHLAIEVSYGESHDEKNPMFLVR